MKEGHLSSMPVLVCVALAHDAITVALCVCVCVSLAHDITVELCKALIHNSHV